MAAQTSPDPTFGDAYGYDTVAYVSYGTDYCTQLLAGAYISCLRSAVGRLPARSRSPARDRAPR